MSAYKKKTLLVLVGIPGSGKTTFRNKLVAEQGAVYTNKDDIRKLHSDVVKKMKRGDFEQMVHKEEMVNLAKLLDAGHDLVVYDNTNLSSKYITGVEAVAVKYGYTVEVHFMMDSMSVELCHRRNTGRPVAEHVPAYIVETMAEKFVGLWFNYQVKAKNLKIAKNDRKKAIIVDLDGTLAHMGSRGAFEWLRVGEDTVDEHVRDLVWFYHRKGWTIIACSGRDAVCREQTEKWMVDNKIPFDYLFMRPVDDMRKDVYIKLEIYLNDIMEHFDVQVCLDDRLQVVRAWRGIGLKCLQVQSGWF